MLVRRDGPKSQWLFSWVDELLAGVFGKRLYLVWRIYDVV